MGNLEVVERPDGDGRTRGEISLTNAVGAAGFPALLRDRRGENRLDAVEAAWRRLSAEAAFAMDARQPSAVIASPESLCAQ